MQVRLHARCAELMCFRVWSLQKSIQNRYQNKTLAKIPKINFDIRFVVPKHRQVLQNACQIDLQSNAERSLFCDAMEASSKLSDVNGGHDL